MKTNSSLGKEQTGKALHTNTFNCSYRDICLRYEGIKDVTQEVAVTILWPEIHYWQLKLIGSMFVCK
jgi:hypothetical protein